MKSLSSRALFINLGRQLRHHPDRVAAVFAALVATYAFGDGLILNDSTPAVHLAPVRFLGRMLSAWDTHVFLGQHSGFLVVYQSPYTWAYALLSVAHVPAMLAQRIVTFGILLLASGGFVRLLAALNTRSALARAAGAVAFVCNPYVGFNLHGSVPMLLSLAEIPLLVSEAARVADGRTSWLRGSVIMALTAVLCGGFNPPLVIMAGLVVLLFAFVRILLALHESVLVGRRLFALLASAAAFGLVMNLSWILPFEQYIRTVWMGGLLDESPLMHNADSSYMNVLRGFGQWSMFRGDTDGPWFAWAAQMREIAFVVATWVPVLVALLGLVVSKRRTAAVFFGGCVVFAVPLAVGYFDNGAISPLRGLYDELYRQLPGFQMFRASYKWVSVLEVGLAGLQALAIDACVRRLQGIPADSSTANESVGQLKTVSAMSFGKAAMLAFAVDASIVRRFAPVALNVVRVFACLASVAPLVGFYPIAVQRANPAPDALPTWTFSTGTMTEGPSTQRAALFPSQYLETFAWGTPSYYIEDALSDRDLVSGFLGSVPGEGSDRLIQRAYRSFRTGNEYAADLFRLLGVDTLVQRGDFRMLQDFAFPGELVLTSPTLSRSLIERTLGGYYRGHVGPTRQYALAGALPRLYRVDSSIGTVGPAMFDAVRSNPAALLRGTALVDLGPLQPPEIADYLKSHRIVATSDEASDLAVDEAIHSGGVMTEVNGSTHIFVPSTQRYAVFVADIGFVEDRTGFLRGLSLDTLPLAPSPKSADGMGWQPLGAYSLAEGQHSVETAANLAATSVLLVAVVPENEYRERLSENRRMLARAHTVPFPRADVFSPLPAGVSLRAASPLNGGEESIALPISGVGWMRRPMPTAVMHDPAAYHDYPVGPVTSLLLGRESVFRISSARSVDTFLTLRLASFGTRHASICANSRCTVVLLGDSTRGRRSGGPTVIQAISQVRAPVRLHAGTNTIRLQLDGPAGSSADMFAYGRDVPKDVRAIAIGTICDSSGTGSTTSPGYRSLRPPSEPLYADVHLYGNASPMATTDLVLTYRSAAGLTARLVPVIGNFDISASDEYGSDLSKGPELVQVDVPLGVDPRALNLSVAPAATLSRPVVDTRSRINTVSSTRLSPALITVKASSVRPGSVLVLNESFHPAWRATMSGIALRHVLVNGYANGWIVPRNADPGAVTIRFSDETPFDASQLASLAAVLAGVLLLGNWRYPRRNVALSGHVPAMPIDAVRTGPLSLGNVMVVSIAFVVVAVAVFAPTDQGRETAAVAIWLLFAAGLALRMVRNH